MHSDTAYVTLEKPKISSNKNLEDKSPTDGKLQHQLSQLMLDNQPGYNKQSDACEALSEKDTYATGFEIDRFQRVWEPLVGSNDIFERYYWPKKIFRI